MNKTEIHDAFQVIDQMIEGFDGICEMVQNAKFNLDGNRKKLVLHSIIGLQQIYDQIEYLEKYKKRKEEEERRTIKEVSN